MTFNHVVTGSSPVGGGSNFSVCPFLGGFSSLSLLSLSLVSSGHSAPCVCTPCNCAIACGLIIPTSRARLGMGAAGRRDNRQKNRKERRQDCTEKTAQKISAKEKNRLHKQNCKQSKKQTRLHRQDCPEKTAERRLHKEDYKTRLHR